MDEGSQIEQESDVREVAIVIPHTSPDHSGKNDDKNEESRPN